MDFATVSIKSLPHGLNFLDGFRVLSATVEGLRSLGRGVSHQDTGGRDIQTSVQILLSERSPAHSEVEFYVQILLHDTLDSAYGIA